MVEVQSIYKTLLENGVDFFTGVPDSLLQSICAYITDNTSRESNIIASNEGAAIGIACGHHLATGKIPLVYMQNSGIGNAVNPLLSLADEKVYSIPLLLMIGWRGEPGVKDEPQHVKQGEVTLTLLDAMQIPYMVLSSENDIALEQLSDIINRTKKESKPHAIVIRKDVFSKYKLQTTVANNYTLSREEAMQLIVDNLQETDIVISTTGKLSRELFEYRESKGQGHERDFLTVGSMGHSSSISLGVSLAKKDRTVYCFDGDGAVLMHMGSLSNIGNLSPTNFKHILFNNGSHESVGGQPTVGFNVDFIQIAKSSGYKAVFRATNREEVLSIMEELAQTQGPALLEVRVSMSSRADLGRPTTTPKENKTHFMNFISKE